MLLVDAPDIDGGRVLECHRSLFEGGADDVLVNAGCEAEVELAISVSQLRWTMGRRHLPDDSLDDDSFVLSESSAFDASVPAAAVDAQEKPSVADCGTNTEISMQGEGLRSMRCPRRLPSGISVERDASAGKQPRGKGEADGRGGRRTSKAHSRQERLPLQRPSPLDGLWVATRARHGGASVEPRPWLRRLRIDGARVVLGDGEVATLHSSGGRAWLHGGALELVGDVMLRHGRTSVVEFRRVRP